VLIRNADLPERCPEAQISEPPQSEFCLSEKLLQTNQTHGMARTVRPIAAACSADLACAQADQRENVYERIRVKETLQSHCRQPVVCLVSVCSQSTHTLSLNAIPDNGIDNSTN